MLSPSRGKHPQRPHLYLFAWEEKPLWETAPTKFYQILAVVSDPATLCFLEFFLWRDGDFPTYTGKLTEWIERGLYIHGIMWIVWARFSLTLCHCPICWAPSAWLRTPAIKTHYENPVVHARCQEPWLWFSFCRNETWQHEQNRGTHSTSHHFCLTSVLG